jgi:hypothetical protein
MDIPLLLTDTRVDCGAREVAFAKKLVELSATQRRSDEDDDLVELEAIKKVVELPVLLTLVELHVELLETVERQLLLVIDIDLKWALHEFLANATNLL